MNEFGLKITSPEEQQKIQEKLKRFALPENDGATNIAYGGYYGYYMDLDGNIQNDIELIMKYRDMASQQEVDEALENIVNEAVIFDDSGQAVDINVDEIEEINDAVKEKIKKEFKNMIRLLKFGEKGYEIFRNWYVDGRLYYHVIMDEDNIQAGIKELEFLDPRKIKKVREIQKERDSRTGLDLVKKIDEYFVYNEMGVVNAQQHVGVKIAKDSVVYVPSGLLNSKKTTVVSYLHKAIKPFNQLRMVEDALVIYRLARAPERRLFYIDVGTMSTQKANQYVRSMQQNFRNKLIYDAETGELRDDRKFMSMLEDFWLPRREGGRGTEISTLPGGQNLGDIEDILYFQKKLYKALNVPISRLEEAQGFSLGRSTEITRDELMFSKFIKKLRKKFTKLFDDILEIQLVVKGICTSTEWSKWKDLIWYDFIKDNNFDELKEAELWRERLDLLVQFDTYKGEYFSKEWIQKKVLRFDDKEIEEMAKAIDKEPSPVDEYGNPKHPVEGDIPQVPQAGPNIQFTKSLDRQPAEPTVKPKGPNDVKRNN